MSAEKNKFTADEVGEEVCEQIDYAVKLLRIGRDALFESKIGKDFEGKPPRSVIMHAIARSFTEIDGAVPDRIKFTRGLISLCLFYLEDEDVKLALEPKDELKDTDDK